MCDRCDEIEAAVARHENLSKRIDEVGRGSFVHRLTVDECPECGAAARSSIEDFLTDGCSNCGYEPVIKFTKKSGDRDE